MHFGQKYGKIKENKWFSGVRDVKSAFPTPFLFAKKRINHKNMNNYAIEKLDKNVTV